jgi:NadR type nicotinamide-nucleotide adenylyltransferase
MPTRVTSHFVTGNPTENDSSHGSPSLAAESFGVLLIVSGFLLFYGLFIMSDAIKKIVVIGPECTGKSALSDFLADYYKTEWVPEYARGYLDNLVRPYNQADLTSIAHGQLRLEDKSLTRAKALLICDTNLYVIKIWSEFKYGSCDPEILQAIRNRKYDLYLLTYVDIAWQEDPLREHPDKRQQLYEIYLKEMQNQSVPFAEIKGVREQRRATAIQAVDKLMQKNG